jgi:hypothetical protein
MEDTVLVVLGKSKLLYLRNHGAFESTAAIVPYCYAELPLANQLTSDIKDSPTVHSEPIRPGEALAVRLSAWHHRCSAPMAVSAGAKGERKITWG